MKLIKTLCTSLLVLTISIIIPSSNLFADENDYPIMPIGQPITQSLSADETQKTYTDGTMGFSTLLALDIYFIKKKNDFKPIVKMIYIVYLIALFAGILEFFTIKFDKLL